MSSRFKTVFVTAALICMITAASAQARTSVYPWPASARNIVFTTCVSEGNPTRFCGCYVYALRVMMTWQQAAFMGRMSTRRDATGALARRLLHKAVLFCS